MPDLGLEESIEIQKAGDRDKVLEVEEVNEKVWQPEVARCAQGPMMEIELEFRRKWKMSWVRRQRPNHRGTWTAHMDDNDLFCSQWIWSIEVK